LSTSKRIDGLWVGTWESRANAVAVLRRVEDALRLIKTFDPLRYKRIGRDLERVWVLVLPGDLGQFAASIKACKLDTRFILADTTSPEMIASTIVHEATHARLWNYGIGYEEGLRARVEAVCLRREIIFSAKLPHGSEVRDRAERTLEWCLTDDHWTDAAFNARHIEGGMEALRHLGAPEWLVCTMPAMAALRLSIGRRLRKMFANRG
jgi:hypothetical protein